MKLEERERPHPPPSIADALSEELVISILDILSESPVDLKSFSLASKSCLTAESRHRKSLRPLRSDLLPSLLRRYPNLLHLDLSLCPCVNDSSLAALASSPSSSTLRSLHLSRPASSPSPSFSFTHLGLSLLASSCLSLSHLDLSNCTHLTDCAADALASAFNLETLHLSRCKLITDLGIGCIAVGCRRLKHIHLKWCLGLTDLGVRLLAVKCKDLRCFDLSYTLITEKCLPSILQLCNLEELFLAGCLGIDDEAFTMVKQGCKSLKALDVSNCPNVSYNSLSLLMNGAFCLQQPVLANCSPDPHALAVSLQKIPNLQCIKLDGCHITCSGLKAIGNGCKSLKELSLSKCLGVTDEGLSSVVAKHRELKKLDITCCTKITHVSISSITTSCPGLTSLRMEACSLVPKEAFVLIGQRCSFLEELDLTENKIDNEGLSSISKCSELTSLKLGICLNITDEGLIHIGGGCPKLRELDLYRSIGISDPGIAAITVGCPRLQIINLAYCKGISDDSLISLSQCPKLDTLEVRGCTHLSSEGLSCIAFGCKHLTMVDIKKCYNIGDAGMIPLARLSQNLRQINLSYCSVTDAGLLALGSISCLQIVTILHVKGLSANGLAAVLLACGRLTKVKLHICFKFLLPQHLICRLEARGCMFQWRDKPFRIEAKMEAN